MNILIYFYQFIIMNSESKSQVQEPLHAEVTVIAEWLWNTAEDPTKQPLLIQAGVGVR